LKDGANWYQLEHAGVIFAPEYKPHNVPLKYDGKVVQLTPEQEEVVSFYAAIPEDGPQLGNPKTREVFQNNFFADFKALLPSGCCPYILCEFIFISIKYFPLLRSRRQVV
jgi:DNA topoisomerase-1